MSRIGAHISAFEMRLLGALRESESAAAVNALRLSTGRRISSPRQDPSGFATLARLENQIVQVQETSQNVAAASSIVSQSQLALDQIRTQLGDIKSLLLEDEDQSLTSAERSANQSKIDEAIEAIESLAGTLIDGRRRLDGSADFRASGANSDQIRDLQVFQPGDGTISGRVISAATRATLTYTGSSGQITDDATLTLGGLRGETAITVDQNDPLTDVATEINRQSHQSGITASVNGDELLLTSVDYGSQARTRVTVSTGSFQVTGGDGNGLATGEDSEVVINGSEIGQGAGPAAATSTVDGNTVHFVSSNQNFRLELRPGFVGVLDPIQVRDEGALRFSLSTELNRTSSLAIPGVLPGHFRGESGRLTDLLSGGDASGLGTNASRALRIVDESLARLTIIEGRVDGFADYAVNASADFLGELESELQDAVEDVNGVDETEEQLLQARNLALAENSLGSLSLLQDQRSRVVGLLQQIAGL